MNTTRIRDALVEVRDAVEVPPLDETAFRRHLRQVRRRRWGGRAAVAAVVVGAVGIAPLAWPQRPDAAPALATSRPPAPVEATAAKSFPVALDGRLENLLPLPDGAGYATRDRVEEVLGSGPAGIVVIGRDGHLLLVPVMASGQPDRPRDLADGEAVQQARLDKSGQYVGFVGLDGRVHLRSVGSTRDLASAALAPGEALAAVGADRWLTTRDGVLTVHTSHGSTSLSTEQQTASAEVAGGTVASEWVDGVEFLDASSGRSLAGISGIAVGSLSPDGARYVASGDGSPTDTGRDRGWYVVDTRTGDRHLFAGRPPRARAASMTWQDDDRFLVLFTDPRQPGNRIVSDCSVALGTCQERYNDAGNTLQIATR